MASYGDSLRQLRERARLTQEEVAERAHVDREMVSRVEASGNVGVLNVQKIAVALDASLSDLFGGRATPIGPYIDLTGLSAEQAAFLQKLERTMRGES